MSILQSIENKIQTELKPIHLKVENESHFHSVPKGSETHFKIEVVAPQFENKRLLERHRLMNEILSEEFSKIKACSLHTFSPAEWEMRKSETTESPRCAGGSKVR